MNPKAKTRNGLSDHIMSYLKTHRTMVKTIHVAPKCSEHFSEDFHPFIPYSMNRKKRWEFAENYLEFLEMVQNHHNGSEVVLLERVRKDPYDWPHHYDTILHEQFKIRAVHRLTHNDQNQNPIYHKSEINSIRGQNFKNYKEKNEKPPEIGYHFLNSPDNYMVMLRKKCIRKKDDDWPYTTGWIREQRWKSIQEDLRYSENFLTEELVFSESDDEETDTACRPSQYYYFMNHIVHRNKNR